jgi:hypothetical protein
MRFIRVIGAIVLAGLLLALGVGVYQAGVIAGAAGNGAAVAPYHWYGPGAWFGPWFGFGLFHLFGFVLFALLIVALVRLVFWGGRGRRAWGGGYGPGRGGDWDQRMREYHDRLHASGASTSAATSAGIPSAGAPGAGPAGPTTPNDPRASG